MAEAATIKDHKEEESLAIFYVVSSLFLKLNKHKVYLT